MVRFVDLPNEIISLIFDSFTVDEMTSLLSFISPALIGLAYHRLYLKTITVINGRDRNNVCEKDDLEMYNTLMELSNFLAKLHEDLFLSISPQCLMFNLIRPANDYCKFIQSIHEFNQLLASHSFYLDKIARIQVTIDGNLLLMENPLAVLSIIINSIIHICNFVSQNIYQLTIQNSEISSLYMSQWGQLFTNLSNLTELNLSGNAILNNDSHDYDILTGFKFPDGLVKLNLDNNLLTFVSGKFIQCLPKSLQTLSVNNNEIIQIDLPNLNKTLPNLHHLCLNNNLLIYINPKNFTSDNFTLEIKYNNIDDLIMQQLKLRATIHNFTIVQ